MGRNFGSITKPLYPNQYGTYACVVVTTQGQPDYIWVEVSISDGYHGDDYLYYDQESGWLNNVLDENLTTRISGELYVDDNGYLKVNY